MHTDVNVNQANTAPSNGSNTPIPGETIEKSEAQLREQVLAELRRSLADHERVATSLKQSLTDNEQTVDLLRQSIEEQEHALLTLQKSEQQRDREMATMQMQLEAAAVDNDYRIALALTLANAAYDAAMILNEKFHIIAINNAAETLFGVQRPIGQSIIQVTGLPELELLLEVALDNPDEPLEDQLTIDRRSYRIRVQSVSRSGYDFITFTLQDVTELVRLNRARRDMVANISHELRTPIANIRLIIEGLFHEQDKPKRKQSTSALRAIARESDSLLWLVQELLDLSMIESGQAILRMIDAPLGALTDEVLERMEDQSEAKDIKLVSTVPPELGVLADPDQIRRVIVNLVHNSVKWSPMGETITVTAEPYGDDEVLVTVLDNGPGVPDDHVDRIFERFYRVDASRSVGEGTGLGLAICKHIVEAHGGKIWAEGNEGGTRGGIFKFTLARAEYV